MALLAEQTFTVLALLLYSGAIGPFIGETNPLAPAKEALAITGFLITLGLLACRWKKVLLVAGRDKLLWLLISFTLLSILWSDYPWITSTKVFPLFRVTIFGLYFASCYTIRKQLKLLVWTFGIGALLSLFIAIFLPYYGVMGHGLIITMELNKHVGTWRGAYIHKTVLGTMMALGTLVSAYCCIQKYSRGFRLLAWAGIILCLSLLIISTTKAALLILCVVLFLIPFYRASRWRDSLIIPFFILVFLIVASLAIIVVTNADDILQIFGRDVTFSGRTKYWPLMLYKALQRPWLGYGYGTFWHGGWKGEPADIWRFLAIGDEPPHAHNGLLNLGLSIGIIGISIFLASYFTACLRATFWNRSIKELDGLVPLCFLTFFSLVNLTESMLLEPDILWLLYVSTTLSIRS